MAYNNTKKIPKYKSVGFDAFLNRGLNSLGEEVNTLRDTNSGKTSALRQSSQTESIDLGQSGSLSIGDGKNTRLFIGTR